MFTMVAALENDFPLAYRDHDHLPLQIADLPQGGFVSIRVSAGTKEPDPDPTGAPGD
jgi:hypothetical protein